VDLELSFLHLDEVLEAHADLINDFGGTHGLRDPGALESALAAAENRAYYEDADAIVCAATYAYHLTQAHAFIDGNKRIAAYAADAFLRFNGIKLQVSNDEIVGLFLDIAAGRLTRDDVEKVFAAWNTRQN
jgi:death-on-curing protein